MHGFCMGAEYGPFGLAKTGPLFGIGDYAFFFFFIYLSFFFTKKFLESKPLDPSLDLIGLNCCEAVCESSLQMVLTTHYGPVAGLYRNSLTGDGWNTSFPPPIYVMICNDQAKFLWIKITLIFDVSQVFTLSPLT